MDTKGDKKVPQFHSQWCPYRLQKLVTLLIFSNTHTGKQAHTHSYTHPHIHDIWIHAHTHSHTCSPAHTLTHTQSHLLKNTNIQTSAQTAWDCITLNSTQHHDPLVLSTPCGCLHQHLTPQPQCLGKQLGTPASSCNLHSLFASLFDVVHDAGLVVRVLADGVADGVDHLLARVRALGVDLLLRHLDILLLLITDWPASA